MHCNIYSENYRVLLTRLVKVVKLIYCTAYLLNLISLRSGVTFVFNFFTKYFYTKILKFK